MNRENAKNVKMDTMSLLMDNAKNKPVIVAIITIILTIMERIQVVVATVAQRYVRNVLLVTF